MPRLVPSLLISAAIFLVVLVISNTLSSSNSNVILYESSTDSSSSITLSVENEYLPLSSLSLYPWDFIVEPYKTTTLKANIDGYDISRGSFSWQIFFEHKGDGAQLLLLEAEGESIEAIFTHSAQAYTVIIEFVDEDITFSSAITVMCKYVRRELRALTDYDREAFLSALEIVYHTHIDVGKFVYGDNFRNHEYFAIKHIGLNACNPFHGVTAFLTSHAAFSLEMDRSLQSIDPSVLIPYWDYTYENIHYGHNWDLSDVFNDDWFGTTQPDNPDNVVTDGRFGYVHIPSSFDRPVFNSYGRVTSRVNNDPSEYMTRSHSICGLPTMMPLPDCKGVLGCFKMDSLHTLHSCLELDVHSYFHLMIGGSWDCPFSGAEIMDEVPQISEIIQLVLFNSMNLWTRLLNSGDLICPDYCSEDTPYSECTCSCPLVDTLMEESRLLPKVVEEILLDQGVMSLMSIYTSNFSVNYEDETIRFDGLTEEENEIFLKWLLLFLCHPGKTGSMGTNGAPNDPLFWPIHPTFDRMFSFIRLAPSFSDFNFTWVPDGTCFGNGYHEVLPFENLFNENDSHFYSNEELVRLFDPSNPELSYVYDSFEWTNCADMEIDKNDFFMQEVIKESKGILRSEDNFIL